MLLAIDIGNTNISFGLLRGKKVTKGEKIASGSPAALRKDVDAVLKRAARKKTVSRVMICSVVPPLTQVVEKKVRHILKVAPEVVGRDIKVPMKNKYTNPRKVGQDRLVGAYAAKCLYGTPAVIIDFGTAITFDVVSAGGAYEGGIIVPGIQLSLESLYAKTALLPDIRRVKAPKSIIGKDTENSILSGIFHGYGAMAEGLIARLAARARRRPRIILTGGHTQLIRKFISHRIDAVDPHLVFHGLRLLAQG